MAEIKQEFQRSHDGYIVIDCTGVIVYANRAVCSHLQYSPQDVINRNIRCLMPSPYAEQHDHFLRRCLVVPFSLALFVDDCPAEAWGLELLGCERPWAVGGFGCVGGWASGGC